MKKMLTILTGLSIIVTPANHIVSCNIATDNTYKNPSDIAKFWNFKYFNTISVGYTSKQKAKYFAEKQKNFETNLKELIANNFKNQEEVNKLLGIGRDESNDNITFKYYSAPKVPISSLEDYLETEFKDVQEPKTVEIYFTYKFSALDEDKNYLKLKVTNVPKMQKEVFSNILFSFKFKNTNYIDIGNSFIANLKSIAKAQSNGKITAELLKDNKKYVSLFIRGILSSIEKTTSIKLFDDLQYIDNENLHNKKEEWIRLTPEKQLLRLLFIKNSDSIEDFIFFINELCDSNSSSAFSNWLGLPSKEDTKKKGILIPLVKFQINN
ncbi:lipoprotein [Spiroplasma endosymbiont of Atherix ibis]|uniref:lipoprotein n=1 Tax=Spiroplasma endosymbiont of Atherix ibis TaxID=3066291 RepID=UPI0030D57855